MDIKDRSALVSAIRYEMKQSRRGRPVDMTVRPPPAGTTFDAEALRVQRDIMRGHPLDSAESTVADKWRRGGVPQYEAYWAVRNQRYDANGYPRRGRNARRPGGRLSMRYPAGWAHQPH